MDGFSSFQIYDVFLGAVEISKKKFLIDMVC